jgi:ribonuclease D
METTTLKPAIWIDSEKSLRDAAQRWQEESRLAIDTESNGLHAYQERICLIQVSTPQADWLIDPFAIEDLAPLGALLRDASIEKVFHAAEYDLICLKRDYGFEVQNLFDTMLAARLLGYQKVGLGNLLAELFGIHLDKKYQKANWARRPLPPEMLHYARMDTHFLLRLRDRLEEELHTRGLWPLAEEDFLLACRVNVPERNAPDWERVAGNHTLDGQEAARLQALLEWREAEAARRDVPPFKVIGNHTLLTLALEPPQTTGELRKAGLSKRQIERYGRDLLRVLHASHPSLRPSRWQRPDQDFLTRLKALGNWRRDEGRRRNLPSDAILPRTLMERLAREHPQTPEALQNLMAETPWRYRQFGEDLLHLLRSLP